MPKMKTLKSASKRFKVKAQGKIKFKRGNARHLLASKSQNTKRSHRKRGYLDHADVLRAHKMLPYG